MINRTMTQPNANPSPSPTPSISSSIGIYKSSGDNVDLFWQWNSLKDKNNRKSMTCDFCQKTSTGGITRAKRHQLGIKGDVGACRKMPEDLKFEMKAAYESKFIDTEVDMGPLEEDEDEDDIQVISRMKRPSSISIEHTSTTKRKGINVKGPLDLLRGEYQSG
ncbi:hypothetical protein Fmac_026572 [Flemingia macrophylla]|uniref:BED-type domain-containing protein n=1 Tax=Flemingia macrophylla TaxID=520843 RepID=A0ABD1LFH7_9FABA